MAEQRIIRINEPGTTQLFDVTMDESTRTEVTALARVAEILKYVILDHEEDGLSDADAGTVATAAATAMQAAGYIQ